MAKPALDNGFIQIACGKPENDILTALASSNLNGTEYAIVLLVIRKTWGWKKNWDWISITTFENTLNKSRPMIVSCLKSLVVKNILLVNKSLPLQPKYAFNERFIEWGSKQKLTSKVKLTSKQNDKQVVNKSLPTKETITKETNTKVLVAEAKPLTKKNPYVEIVLSEFQSSFSFRPTDKKPRFVAHNFSKNIQAFLKTFNPEVTEARFTKVIRTYLDWLLTQDYANRIETLDLVRRKFSIWADPQVTSYQKGRNATTSK